MNETDTSAAQHVFRVAVYDAHLEFLVDGEGEWIATLNGVVERSDHDAVPTGLPLNIRFGGYDPEVWGLHVGPTGASVIVTMESTGIEPLQALLAQCRPQGPSLTADVTVGGEPERRSDKPGHVWRICQAAPSLSHRPITRVKDPAGLDFDADLRIAADAEGLTSVEGGGPLQFSGPVIASRHGSLPEGMRVMIRLDPGAERKASVSADHVAITWPLTDVDARGLLETIELAGPGEILIDLDMGQVRSDPDPKPWHITDMAVIAPGLLAGKTSSEE